MLEVLTCPAPASLQDLGRSGYRHLGVPLSGALDAEWLQLANALVGNPPNAAAIEMRLAGPLLASDAEAVFAIAGEVDARILGVGGERAAAPWKCHRLGPGEQLRVAATRSGVAYLAFAGGIDGVRQLGSRSRYERAELGSAVGAGCSLKVGAGATALLQRLAAPLARVDAPLRVIAGPQRDYFTDAAWATFLNTEFSVSREADRMGLRLDGPRLAHDPAHGVDIISDAVTPGAIQVPGDGRPIILLADCQTVGGYPKIATVIGADLPRLGHALPGKALRFVEVGLDEALAARREAAAALAQCIASMVPDRAGFDLDALYAANLIDGVIDAQH